MSDKITLRSLPTDRAMFPGFQVRDPKGREVLVREARHFVWVLDGEITEENWPRPESVSTFTFVAEVGADRWEVLQKNLQEYKTKHPNVVVSPRDLDDVLDRKPENKHLFAEVFSLREDKPWWKPPLICQGMVL